MREAEAAAALDHPNICTVFEIDEAEGRDRLVSEKPLTIHVVHNWFEEFRGPERDHRP